LAVLAVVAVILRAAHSGIYMPPILPRKTQKPGR